MLSEVVRVGWGGVREVGLDGGFVVRFVGGVGGGWLMRYGGMECEEGGW